MMIRVTATVVLTAMAWQVGPARAQQPNAVEPNPVQADPSAGQQLHPRLTMATSLGDIVLELDAEKAPHSTNNFVQHANDGYYTDTVFHRVMKNFMIQGGGYTAGMDEKSGALPAILNEWRNGLKNTRGAIAMARLSGRPHSATSEFFINVVDNPSLDQAQKDGAAYAVFGSVIAGMEVVEQIRAVQVGPHDKYANGRAPTVPVEPVVIQSVTRSDGGSLADLAAVLQAHVQALQQRRIDEIISAAEAVGGHSVQRTESGLMSVIEKPGAADGASPQPTDRVRVHYTGWLLDGSKFDSSVDRKQPEEFALNGVIRGWTEGVGLMAVGEIRTLIMPAELAYGTKGRVGIPPNAVLHFQVELLAINP